VLVKTGNEENILRGWASSNQH